MNIHIFPQLPLVFVGFQLIVIWLLKKQGRTQVFLKNDIKGDHLKNPLILNKSRRKEFTATLVKSSSSWVAGVVTGRWWWWHDAGGGVQLSNVAVKWLKLVPRVPLRTIYYAPWPQSIILAHTNFLTFIYFIVRAHLCVRVRYFSSSYA